MSIILIGATSGSITLSEPAVAGTTTLDLPATSGTVVVGSAAVSATGQIPFSTNGTTYTPTAKIVQGTAVASTSGTSITFTSIPSWVKRITVMFNGVSTSGTSLPIIQIGSGSTTTTGYNGVSGSFTAGVGSAVYGGSGFPLTNSSAAADAYYGLAVLTNVSSNNWIASINGAQTSSNRLCLSNGSLALGGVLDRVVITTSNGTDTFDAGSVNILYE
jgi:hypothetical protein